MMMIIIIIIFIIIIIIIIIIGDLGVIASGFQNRLGIKQKWKYVRIPTESFTYIFEIYSLQIDTALLFSCLVIADTNRVLCYPFLPCS
jgi:hypothetical protein